jgi:hypothetical protein
VAVVPMLVAVTLAVVITGTITVASIVTITLPAAT